MGRRGRLAIATVLLLAAGCVGGQAILAKGWLPIGLCGGILGPRLKVIDPKSLVVQASLDLPGRVLRADVSPLEDLCGGSYFYLDNEDRAVVATTDRSIVVVKTPELVTQRTFSLASWVPGNGCLIAPMPDWSGRIWLVTSAAASVPSIPPRAR